MTSRCRGNVEVKFHKFLISSLQIVVFLNLSENFNALYNHLTEKLAIE
jgi:hypothetical protein